MGREISGSENDGFEAVEFWDWRIRDLEATRKAAEAAGIMISGFNGDADYSLVDPTHKEKYIDYLETVDSGSEDRWRQKRNDPFQRTGRRWYRSEPLR